MPVAKNDHESSQTQKFVELARQLGANEDETRFEETVRKIASAPKAPKPDPDA